MRKFYSVLIFLVALAGFSPVSFAVRGTVCNDNHLGWCFFSNTCPGSSSGSNIDCESRSDKCCPGGSITTADSSRWVDTSNPHVQDWSGTCKSTPNEKGQVCTPFGRLCINSNYSCPDPKTCKDYPGKYGTFIEDHCNTYITCVVPYVEVMRVQCPGTKGEVRIAGIKEGTASKLKIQKGGSTYAVDLVDASAADDEKSCVHVNIDGTAKILRKCKGAATETDCG